MKRDAVPGAEAVPPAAFVEPAIDAGPSIESPQPAPVRKPGPSPANKDQPSVLRPHRWQALAALIVLIGAGALGVRWWLGPQVVTQSVLRRDFVQTVVASGHVEAPHRLDVGVQITGTVLRIPVIEGQAVRAGGAEATRDHDPDRK